MEGVKKGFPLRWSPALIARMDQARGPLSRNAWLAAITEEALERIENPLQTVEAKGYVDPDDLDSGLREPKVDVSEVGEPAGLQPFDDDRPVADPVSAGDVDEDWWKR